MSDWIWLDTPIIPEYGDDPDWARPGVQICYVPDTGELSNSWRGTSSRQVLCNQHWAIVHRAFTAPARAIERALTRPPHPLRKGGGG